MRTSRQLFKRPRAILGFSVTAQRSSGGVTGVKPDIFLHGMLRSTTRSKRRDMNDGEWIEGPCSGAPQFILLSRVAVSRPAGLTRLRLRRVSPMSICRSGRRRLTLPS
jgi:hypothetical protein